MGAGNLNQILLVNKPWGWTSFQVVKRLRRALQELSGLRKIKVGHAGTLDPLATGLLIVCSGQRTKEITALQELPKEYLVEFRLGASTASYDAEFPPENQCDTSHLTLADLQSACEHFRGSIQQEPPPFSALKVQGTPAYKLAREKQPFRLTPRPVHIYSLDLLEFTHTTRQDAHRASFDRAAGQEMNSLSAQARAKVVCSKGTYIRSLVHDLGQLLGVGAYVQNLQRRSIGPYRLEDAYTVPELIQKLPTIYQTHK